MGMRKPLLLLLRTRKGADQFFLLLCAVFFYGGVDQREIAMRGLLFADFSSLLFLSLLPLL